MPDLTVPTSGTTSNPFTPSPAALPAGSAVGSYLAGTAQTAQSNIGLSLGANPDLEAELSRISKQTGVPIESARAFPDQVKQTATMQGIDFDKLARQFPATAAFYQSINNARVAHDDVQGLSGVEQATSALSPRSQFSIPQQWAATPNATLLGPNDQMTADVAGGVQQAMAPPLEQSFVADNTPLSYRTRLTDWVRGLLGLGPGEGNAQGRASAQAFIQRYALDTGTSVGDMRNAVGGMSEIPTQFAQGFENSSLAGLAPDVNGPAQTTSGQVASGLGNLAGFMLGAPLKLAEGAVEHVGGSVLEHTATESFAKGLARDVGRQASTLGLASAITATGQALDANNPGASLQTLAQAGAGGAEMGGVFGAMGRILPDTTVVQGIARAVATNGLLDVFQGQTPWDNRSLSDKVFNYGLNTLFSMAGAGRAPGGWLTDAARADIAMGDHANLSNLAAAAADSKLRARDPDAFKDFVAQANADGPVQNVFVDAKTFANALEQSGLKLDDVQSTMPRVAAQLPEALATGGDVSIPVEDFATHIAGGPMQDTLLPQLKTDPEGMTQEQANAFYQSSVDQFQQAAQTYAGDKTTEGATAQSAQAVHDAVLQQLTDANRFRPDVNQVYAALARETYTSAAARAGVTPEEMYQRYPLRITADDVTGANALSQEARGKLSFADDITSEPSTITLGKDADLSTFVHELGHFNLEMLDHMARSPLPEPAVPDGHVRFYHGGLDLPDVTSRWITEDRKYAEGYAAKSGDAGKVFYTDLPETDPRLQKAFDDSGVPQRAPYSPFEIRDAEAQSMRKVGESSVTDDFKTLTDWFGTTPEAYRDMTLDQKRDYHEQFARGFEAYLFEGKAPSEALRGVFQRVRAWMVSVYRSLRNLNVQLSPEVRGVFDRLLASNDAIRDAESSRAMAPMFKTPEEAGMQPDEFAAYHALGNEATLEASDELSARTLRDMRYLEISKVRALREVSKDVATKRRAVREEIAGQVAAEPTYQAENFIRRGELPEGDRTNRQRKILDSAAGGSTKLSLEALKEMYGEGEAAPWRYLDTGKNGLAARDGVHPDLMAELFGFNSGDELVRSLLSAEPQKDVVDALTDQRMLERYGDISSPEAMNRAANEAIHNDVRTRFIATELKALAKATGPVSALTRAAKEVAETTIAQARIRDLSAAKYGAAETRSAKAADAARAKGDLAEAAQEKRNQLLNNQLQKTAAAAQTEIAKSVDYLKKFSKSGVRDNLSGDYLAQIDALLDRYDLRTSVSSRSLDKRASLLEWVQQQQEAGYDPAIPDALMNEAMRGHYKDMSLEAFRGLVDSVKSIEHLGRMKQKLLDAKDLREFTAVVDDAVAQAGKLPQRAPDDVRNPGQGGRGLDRVNAKYLNAKSAVRNMDASLLKMEQVIDWLDQHDPNGVFNRVVFRRIADAGTRENDLHTEMAGKLRDIANATSAEVKGDFSTRYTIPELTDSRTGQPSRMLKSEIIAMALNTGNESNYQKLLQGEKWNDQAVQQVLARHMSKGDWDFVQKTWDAIESLWPHVEDLEKRMSGVAPPKVVPREVVTPHGTYRGGYYPAVYDPLRNFNAEKNRQKGADLFDNNYQRAATSKGYTMERNENYSAPLYLSLDVLPRHIAQVVHDVAYREAVIDADRFLNDSRVRGAIEGTLGREIYSQFRPWLQSIANDKAFDSRGLSFWENMAHAARTNATMVGLGFRISTMLVHGSTALSNSIGEVGPKWMASGMRSFLSEGAISGARDFIFERSGEMRNRMNEIDRDIRDALRDMDLHSQGTAIGTAGKGLDAVKRFAYFGVAQLDMMSAMPTWMGAYNKALHEGMAEQDAIYAADKAVRNAHGAGGVKDLSAVQRSKSEFMKLTTMFYSFWNHFYNRQRDIARTAASIPGSIQQGNYQKAAGDFGMVLARSLFYFIVPQMLHALINPHKGQGAGDDPNEPLALWAAKEIGLGMFSGIPIVRDLASSAMSGEDYKLSPVVQMVSSLGKSGKDIVNAAEGKPVSDQWVKHAVQNTGYVFGLPTGQGASTAQFLWDVGDGKQSPQDLSDWYHGLVFGRTDH